jgi:XRE family aerobic/anaerobic benzoate catabolism transcriptional regulator
VRIAGSEEYLAGVGAKVRRIRAQRGMSRKMLAQQSGVSERYLAELEAGKGNVSIVLLRQIGQAMNVPVDDLLDEASGRPVEYALLRNWLREAGEAELQRLYGHVAEGRSRSRGRVQRVALIGLRGAGKSTLGAALAQRLRLPFVELAQEIEREAGMAIADIFTRGDQATYRRYERQALHATIKRFPRAIIAAGGSLVSEAATFELLLASSFTIWVRATPEEHMNRVIAQGDYRPMADNRQAMEDLRRILKERDPLYRRADVQVDTSGRGVAEVLEEILALEPIRQNLSPVEAAI